MPASNGNAWSDPIQFDRGWRGLRGLSIELRMLEAAVVIRAYDVSYVGDGSNPALENFFEGRTRSPTTECANPRSRPAGHNVAAFIRWIEIRAIRAIRGQKWFCLHWYLRQRDG